MKRWYADRTDLTPSLREKVLGEIALDETLEQRREEALHSHCPLGLDFEVVLRGGVPLGMTLTHNTTHADDGGKIGCKVTHVDKEGAAVEAAGQICKTCLETKCDTSCPGVSPIIPQDWIIAVDDKDVSEIPKDDVIAVITAAMATGEPVTMRFRRTKESEAARVAIYLHSRSAVPGDTPKGTKEQAMAGGATVGEVRVGEEGKDANDSGIVQDGHDDLSAMLDVQRNRAWQRIVLRPLMSRELRETQGAMRVWSLTTALLRRRQQQDELLCHGVLRGWRRWTNHVNCARMFDGLIVPAFERASVEVFFRKWRRTALVQWRMVEALEGSGGIGGIGGSGGGAQVAQQAGDGLASTAIVAREPDHWVTVLGANNAVVGYRNVRTGKEQVEPPTLLATWDREDETPTRVGWCDERVSGQWNGVNEG